MFGCLTKLGAQRAELVQKFVPRSRVGIFRNERTGNTPLEPKLTFWCVSNYLGASGTVWLPYETRCKTGRKVQKFVPRTRIRIFRNERTRSSHLDPKLTFFAFRTIWVQSGPFGCLTKHGAKTGRTSKNVRVGIFCNERTRSTPLDPKLTFWCASYYLGAFEAVWLPYEIRCKTGRTSTKVRATGRV